MNQKQIIREILAQQEKLLVREATARVKETIFEPAVEEMKRDFESHPITQEIEQGPFGENISNTLIGVKEKETSANIYSFIGFDPNDGDPLEPIREILEREGNGGAQVRYIRGSQRDNLSFKFEFLAPSKELIFKETPMPWANGLSWADRIEKGIPGVAKFLARQGIQSSRSGGGIQVKGDVSPDAKFRNTSYISGIINRFVANIKKRIKGGI